MTNDSCSQTRLQQMRAIARNQGLLGFLCRSRDYVFSRAFGQSRVRFAIPAFRERSAHADNVDAALEVAFSFRSCGIKISPFQDRDEVGKLIRRVSEMSPERIVEIGTGWGGTLFLLCVAAAPNAVLTSVDMPPALIGGGYPRWREPLYKSFARDGQRIDIIRGDSHNASTASAVADSLGGRQADFLFIDGDHTYEGVKSDFELYSPMVHPGGILAMHDIVLNESNKEIDVHRFWKEIRREYETEEIVINGHMLGIGLIHV